MDYITIVMTWWRSVSKVCLIYIPTYNILGLFKIRLNCQALGKVKVYILYYTDCKDEVPWEVFANMVTLRTYLANIKLRILCLGGVQFAEGLVITELVPLCAVCKEYFDFLQCVISKRKISCVFRIQWYHNTPWIICLNKR